MKRLPRILAFALCSLAVFGGSSLAQTCSPTLFIEAATYPVGTGTSPGLAIGDFNGDGLPDAAVVSYNPSSLSILLNDGNGGLGAPIITPIDNNAVAIAAADLRGNGTTDVILALYSGIYVLLGHGDGTFDDPVFYDAELSNLTSITLGKFDGNGTWDVAVGSYYSDTIALLPGNGDGTFGAPLHTSHIPQVLSLTSADFNGDGHLDLAASTPNLVEVFLGHGDGTFGLPSGFIAGASLSGIVSGDFDGDGHADLAVGSGSYVSVLIGNGGGGFRAALQYPSGVGNVGLLRVGDLDGDGNADIVAGEELDFYGDGNEVSVLRGAGDGSFSVGEAYATAGSVGLAIADFDGDGLADVATAGGAFVSILRDTPDGELLAVPDSHLNGPNNNSSVARGDWNGDGLVDFAWIYGNQILIIQGKPGGRFDQAFALDMGDYTNQQPNAIAPIALYDGRDSLIVTTYSDVLLVRSNGSGMFDPPVSIFNGSSIGAVAVGQFDGLQGSDVVAFQGCCGSDFLVTLLGNGDGTFQPPVQTAIDADVYQLVAADFTRGVPPPSRGDSDDLIVVANGSVRILLSDNLGGFTPSAVFPTPQFLQAVVASGQFTTPGANDLLIGAGDANLLLYPGNGNGTFQPPVAIALSGPPSSVSVGLYDPGFNWDFAAVTQQGILVFLGLGDGQFESPIALQSVVAPSLIVTTDFGANGADGISAIGTGGIAAFRNSALAVFLPPAHAAVVGSAATLHALASGYGSLSYQWRKGGTPLSDGGSISGSQTATLTIDPVAFDDAGSYDVIVTDSCTSSTSQTVTLSVEFADVPVSSPFHEDILAVATAGIAAGCGGSNYCPTSPVRRDQMAVFLLKSEHGSGYTPPACSGVFADVPCPSSFADWVEQLAAEGVTGGCGGGNYCPSDSVTRAQMAVFLLKTSQGSSYAPPPAIGIFGDVPVGSFAADFIEDLYNRGITGGCQVSPMLYCPGNAVLRQQMATFLVRTFF
ncbi:MAG TPA: FG-GAP-like repeat-containing protein [Thermoanaerobaculia bacterium]|nr:FG-GAP-like repeat-containing protein [Thermoanaerobaculia bacterium]